MKIISYEASLTQYIKGKLSPGSISETVVLQRGEDNPSGIVFTISADTMELIYDSRFGFEVNHKRLTVNQDYEVLEMPQYYLINPEGKIISASKNGFEQRIEDIIKKHLK